MPRKRRRREHRKSRNGLSVGKISGRRCLEFCHSVREGPKLLAKYSTRLPGNIALLLNVDIEDNVGRFFLL
jgi:hypothetical protein